MIALVKELICDGINCNETLHFDTELSDRECRRIAREKHGWIVVPGTRLEPANTDICPKGLEQ